MKLNQSIVIALKTVDSLKTDLYFIAKTIVLINNDNDWCIAIVVSGESDNIKFKRYFGFRLRTFSLEDALLFTSHKVGVHVCS